MYARELTPGIPAGSVRGGSMTDYALGALCWLAVLIWALCQFGKAK